MDSLVKMHINRKYERIINEILTYKLLIVRKLEELGVLYPFFSFFLTISGIDFQLI